MTTGGSSAADITVAQTLALLDGPFSGLAKGVAEGRYAFWLGSGISLDRVPGVSGLVVKVLEFLQANVDPSLGDECPHRKALAKAVELGDLPADTVKQIDLDQEVVSWPPLDQLVRALVRRYSQLLDIPVTGKPRDYLLWEGVDVRAEYGNCAEPDCEHVAFAMLVLEGVASDAPTPNWDGLIEVALEELSGSVDTVTQVVVLKDEVPTLGRNVRLLKFHGCAVLVRRDPDRYRSALVAQRSRITKWPHDSETAAVRNELVSLATTKPTLMIGLSAQDANIQDIFAAAEAAMSWPWPAEVPAHVFSGETLGDDHANILRIVYGDAYEGNEIAIEEGAAIRAYGKQLLTALVLHVLCAKLSALIETCEAPQLDDDARAGLHEGVTFLRDLLAAGAEPDRLRFLRNVISGQTRILKLFQAGSEPPLGSTRYAPLTGKPVHQIATEPMLPTSGLRELAAAGALLGRGVAAGRWRIEQGKTASGSEGAIRLVPDGAPEAAIHFAANTRAALELERNEFVDPNADDVVIIHSSHPVSALPRSPAGPVGRTGKIGVRDVDMCELLKTATSLDDLEERFREAAIV
jgi:hypothetical protein